MSNWRSPRPREGWSDKEFSNFLREIYDRFKWFTVDIPVGLSVLSGGTLSVFVSLPGAGGDVETESVRGLRRGMPAKLTYSFQGSTPPTDGLTWDCSVQSDDSLNIWFNNSSAGPISIQDGPWTVMGVIA